MSLTADFITPKKKLKHPTNEENLARKADIFNREKLHDADKNLLISSWGYDERCQNLLPDIGDLFYWLDSRWSHPQENGGSKVVHLIRILRCPTVPVHGFGIKIFINICSKVELSNVSIVYCSGQYFVFRQSSSQRDALWNFLNYINWVWPTCWMDSLSLAKSFPQFF